MKLLHGGLSPFVRKVMVVAHELGVVEKLELIPAPVNPLEPLDSVIDVNPLGKIPALKFDNGGLLYGASPICQYLDAKFGKAQFFPSNDALWEALRRNYLGDGILDAGNLVRIETLRPETARWDKWRDVQQLKLSNTLNALENEAEKLSRENPAIGEVAIGCALGWLDIRLPDIEWRDGRPNLGLWFSEISKRPSMILTEPKLPK